MVLKETLRTVVKSQKAELATYEYGIPRVGLAGIDLEIPFALVISGIRRCGKSTLMRQVMGKAKNPYYFKFEDTRITDFEVNDFEKLDEIFREEYGASDYYFFDEIQNVTQWEIFVRKLLDQKKRVMITGSNASLLSKELGTRLTGRHLNNELFPFSYKEYLVYTSKEAGIGSFEDYFQNGGFPEYLTLKKTDVLQELVEDIIERDIVIRHQLKSAKIITEIALYLLSNVGKEFSYNNLAKTFGLGSANSAIDYVSYLEDSYLIFSVPMFDYSLKKQAVNAKKAYSIDNGVSNVNSASFNADRGSMLENIVFLGLKRQNKEIFYFKKDHECDFVIREKRAITEAIQVCLEMHEDNKEREISGLVEALEMFGLKQGLILTYDQEDEIKADGKRIILKPVWKWLMENP